MRKHRDLVQFLLPLVATVFSWVSLSFPGAKRQGGRSIIAMETSPQHEQAALPTNCSSFNRCGCWFCRGALMGMLGPVTVSSRRESWRSKLHKLHRLSKWTTGLPLLSYTSLSSVRGSYQDLRIFSKKEISFEQSLVFRCQN